MRTSGRSSRRTAGPSWATPSPEISMSGTWRMRAPDGSPCAPVPMGWGKASPLPFGGWWANAPNDLRPLLWAQPAFRATLEAEGFQGAALAAELQRAIAAELSARNAAHPGATRRIAAFVLMSTWPSLGRGRDHRQGLHQSERGAGELRQPRRGTLRLHARPRRYDPLASNLKSGSGLGRAI